MKNIHYPTLLIGLLLLLLTLLPGCSGNDHLDNAQDYLARASEATGELRSQLDQYEYHFDDPILLSREDYNEMLDTIEDIEWLIAEASSELYYMEPHYDPPERY